MTTTQGPEGSKTHLTIGEVVEKLKERYPDLSISKIRYLEDEGLLTPERTSGGYRKFSPRDIQRLDVIMRLQTEHFLPLAVIKRKLSDLDMGQVPAELQGAGGIDSLGMPPSDSEQVSLEDVLSATGLSSDTIGELETYGLVKPVKTAQGRVYDSLDVEILKACRGLSQFGIEPRHLRMYGTFAQRESAFFSQIVLPAMHQAGTDEKGKRKMGDVLRDLSRGTQHLHALLLRRAMREDFGDESP